MRHSTASSTAPNTAPSTAPSAPSTRHPTTSTEATPRLHSSSPPPTDLTASEPPPSEKRTRHERKRRIRVLPPPAISVKGLWEAASLEERERAMEIAIRIIEMWLGKTTRREAAQHLKVPLVRMNQLDRQAMSGLMAGLLIQPRTRKKRADAASAAGGLSALVMRPSPANDPELLKKQVRQLKQELLASEQVNALLRRFPVLRDSESADAKPSTMRRKNHAATPDPKDRAAARGSLAPIGERETRRPRVDRDDAGGVDADRVELGTPRSLRPVSEARPAAPSQDGGA